MSKPHPHLLGFFAGALVIAAFMLAAWSAWTRANEAQRSRELICQASMQDRKILHQLLDTAELAQLERSTPNEQRLTRAYFEQLHSLIPPLNCKNIT